jgi:hypothetical protein
MRPPLVQDDPYVNMDVLSTDDLIYGTLIALVLAFTASYLQGRANQSDTSATTTTATATNSAMIIDSNVTDSRNVTVTNETYVSGDQRNIVFDGDSWQEMSRPDNYILYNRKLRQGRRKGADDGRALETSSNIELERVWIIVALLALFIPIFFVEIFFALSRQLICSGDIMNQPNWAEYWCSPVK